MERVEWWPFLISRGRRTPFRTVVVPDLPGGAADGLEPVLLDAAGGKPTPEGQLRFRVVERSDADDLALVFRVIRPDPVEAGERRGPLYDAHSRPIYLIEGVLRTLPAVASDGGPRPWVPQGALRTAHEHNVPAFQRFWQTDRYDLAPVRSKALSFPANASAERAQWSVSPPFRVRARRPAKPDPPPPPPPAVGSRRGRLLLWWGALLVLAVVLAFALSG